MRPIVFSGKQILCSLTAILQRVILFRKSDRITQHTATKQNSTREGEINSQTGVEYDSSHFSSCKEARGKTADSSLGNAEISSGANEKLENDVSSNVCKTVQW